MEITLGIVLEMNVRKDEGMNRFLKKDVQLNGMPTNKKECFKTWQVLYLDNISAICDINIMTLLYFLCYAVFNEFSNSPK